jgi:hypothetical protein
MARSTLTRLFAAVMTLTLVAATTSVGQITAQVGAGIGAVLPSGDYAGSTAEYYAGSKYGLSTGFNVHGKARLGLFGFIVSAQAGYSSLSNTGDAPGGGSLEVSHTILSLSVGPEFQFSLPAVPLTPYLGLNVLVNRFSGETVFKGIASVPSKAYPLEGAFRVGAGVSGGVVLSMGPGMKLDVNASYGMLNLVGKAWTDPQPTSDDQTDSYGGLNDDKDPLIAVGGQNHFISSARSISVIGFSATLMFGL